MPPRSKATSPEPDTPVAGIDLARASAAQLAEMADPVVLLGAVKALRKWSVREAHTLDAAYRLIFARLLHSRATADELAKWSEHLMRVMHPSRRSALESFEVPYLARWTGFRDLIETRIAMLRAGLPQGLLRTGRIEDIVKFVLSKGETSQREIHERFLSHGGKSNVTKVLKLLEAHELIERRRDGRNNAIVPGAKALEYRTQLVPPAPVIPHPRGPASRAFTIPANEDLVPANEAHAA